MIDTSRMSGTSWRVVRPGASSAAAMSLRALFFAPVTRTRPRRAVPPVTRKHSTGPPYGAGGNGPIRAGGGAYARHHDRPADPHLHEDRRRRFHASGRHEP